MDTKTAAEIWHSTSKEVADWCKNDLVPGAEKTRGKWIIPNDARRPLDRKLQKELLWQLLLKQNGAVTRIDLTAWGIVDNEVAAYYLEMHPRFLRWNLETDDGIAGVVSLAITDAGFRLLGRIGPEEKVEISSTLVVVSRCAGIVLETAVRHCLLGSAAELGQ